MADEPRRSGRATKGQHKNLDLTPDVPTKKSKAKSQSKDKPPKPSAEPTPAPSEEEEIIRCICGEYEEEEDVERDMICCDKCSAWQHNDCMGLTFAKGEEPAEYFCEQCKPENHKVLLDKIARGEKPWEEAAKIRQQQAEEKKARRKKGKKGGKKARPSDAKSEVSVELPSATTATPTPAPAATPVHDQKNGATSETLQNSGQKRKFEENQEATELEVESKSKQRRLSSQSKPDADHNGRVTPGHGQNPNTAASPPQQAPVEEKAAPGTVGTPEEIANPARRSVASALVKLFVDQIPEALKRGSFQLPAEKSAEDVGRQLGLAIENAMYQNICGGSGEPSEPYKLQLRTILFNVKKNPSLRDRLLVGSLSPEALSKMSSQDMASEELQQKDAEIKREAEKQHIIVQELGPRIRRTHKGEEIIEDDNQNVASESIFSKAPTRPVDDSDDNQRHSPASPNVQHQHGSARLHHINTGAGDKDIDGDQHTWQPVRSPGGTTHDQVFPEVPVNIREPVTGGRVQADAEIDQLLKDEEAESPPYSPKDFHDDGLIWRGRVVMNPVAEFSASAKHVGGADLSGRIPWSQLAPSTLLIDGRIDIQLASNYLCGLRFSTSTDVTVISISAPEFPADRAGFDKLFNYFADRKRYGVIGKHPLPSVKDTYIVPIEAGSTKKPEFIELLENNTLEEPTLERMLLVVFVVKTGDSSNNTPSAQPAHYRPSQEPPMSIASPLTSTSATPQQSHTVPAAAVPGSHISPPPQSAYVGNMPVHNVPIDPAQQHLQQSYLAAREQRYHPPQPHHMQLTGALAAAQLLGPQAKAPAIEQLLQRAPNADMSQLSTVRDILLRVPAAANDYNLLTQELYKATTGGQLQRAG
ncbi:transcription factor S-II, central domain-containing protein [Paecilomyces variotii]|uniref:Transcription factor BYE1 n=1 Tax=Byssochlamys spectabilis TaxID=264951 RepID=A0A443I105_BYSSP|nr:transcription factor S-II, central domain-containing protein [Paecilomyces variotii]KAJ9365252.1 hypothetical protein DTO280E4_907 [Paecilomyces variotii]RWQ97721.1 transcription factor S-II, central domain-containing protein [Paecilomyces variotii]